MKVLVILRKKKYKELLSDFEKIITMGKNEAKRITEKDIEEIIKRQNRYQQLLAVNKQKDYEKENETTPTMIDKNMILYENTIYCH